MSNNVSWQQEDLGVFVVGQVVREGSPHPHFQKEKFELIDKRGKYNSHLIHSSKKVNYVDFIIPKADLHSFHTKSHLIFAQNLGISILNGLCHVPCEMFIEHLSSIHSLC